MPEPIITTRVPALSPDFPPPQGLYVPPDSFLRVEHLEQAASRVITIRGSLLDTAGGVQRFQYQAPTTGGWADTVAFFPLGEGWLLHVTVQLSTSAPQPSHEGECYINLGLQTGNETVAPLIATIAEGYISAFSPLGYPPINRHTSTEGPGALHQFSSVDPAAGAELTQVIGVNERLWFVSLRFTLVTDATAVVRRVHIIHEQASGLFADFAAADTQAASLTRNYNVVGDGFQRAAQDSEIYIPMPRFVPLRSGWTIRTLTTNLQAGDNFSAGAFLFRQWGEPNQ
jgi:hypothetical protein